MTVTLPAPYGKANWTNYVDYWREEDAEWLQDRLVLRVPNDAARNALALSAGSVVYNENSDLLELKLKGGVDTGFQGLRPLPDTLTTSIVGAVTTIGHTGASGKGIGFSPAEVSISARLNVQGGTVVVDGGSLGYLAIKTGTNAEARLKTTATNLDSSLPLSAPALTLTGTGTVLSTPGGLSVGTLSASSAGISGALSVGGAITGGINSSISSVAFRSGYLEAASGYVSSNGYFHGQSDSALMRYRDATTGAMGSSYLQVTQADVVSAGGNFWMYSTLLIRGGKAINYYSGDGNFRGYIAPSLYSATDPGVGNFPDGTIWIS